MSPERPIVEKFDGLRRLIFVSFSAPIFVLLLVALFSRKIIGVEIVLGVFILFYLFSKLIQRIDRGQKSAWFLVENGLKSIGPSGQKEEIPWSEIKRMKYASCFGLFIHCNKIGSNGIEKVIYQGVNVVLGVDKEEAKQLFQLWQEISIQNKSAVERQHPVKKRRAKKAAGFFDLLQGGKSVVVGIMALPLAFLELLSGRWLLSLLWSPCIGYRNHVRCWGTKRKILRKAGLIS